MKIAIFGGTFDPIHIGHLEIIKNLSKRFDKVVVVPTTVRYYKKNTQMFSFNERFEMVKDKVKGISNVEVSDVERNVNDDWRYIDTLSAIIHKYNANGESNEYFTVMGADSLVKFNTWAEPEKIRILSRLVVFGRPGVEVPAELLVGVDYVDMNIETSSTEVRNRLREIVEQDFDEMIDDMTWGKEYFDDSYDVDDSVAE